MATCCAPAQAAKEPRRYKVLTGKTLLLADIRSHACAVTGK
jgi:hypothetical protein